MTNAPWSAEIDLSEADVVNLITAQFPDLAPVHVSTLGEGWDGKAFEVNGRWVFRFPKRSDVAPFLACEIEFLPALATALPVPIPAVVYSGRGSAAFPYCFMGYPKLGGMQASALWRKQVRVDQLAPQLSRFLSALHAYPVERARRYGVGRVSARRDLPTLRRRALDLYALARKNLPDHLAERCAAFLDDEGAMPPSFTGAECLVHNDLNAEHILLDTASGKISGIIDWGDLGFGDPAVDLSGLYAWLGNPFVEAVVAGYTGVIDAGTLSRARYIAVCLGVYSLAAEASRTEVSGSSGRKERGSRGDRARGAAGVHTLMFAAEDGVLPRSGDRP